MQIHKPAFNNHTLFSSVFTLRSSVPNQTMYLYLSSPLFKQTCIFFSISYSSTVFPTSRFIYKTVLFVPSLQPCVPSSPCSAGSAFRPCPEQRARRREGPGPGPVTARPQRGRAGRGAQGPRAHRGSNAAPGTEAEGGPDRAPTHRHPPLARPPPWRLGPSRPPAAPEPGPARLLPARSSRGTGGTAPRCRRSGTRPRPRPRRAPPPPSPPTRDRAVTTRDRGARRSDRPRPLRGARGHGTPPCDVTEAAPPRGPGGGRRAGPRLRRRGGAGPVRGLVRRSKGSWPWRPWRWRRRGAACEGLCWRSSSAGARDRAPTRWVFRQCPFSPSAVPPLSVLPSIPLPLRLSARRSVPLPLRHSVALSLCPPALTAVSPAAGRAGERRWQGRRWRRLHPRGRRCLREEAGGRGGAVLQVRGPAWGAAPRGPGAGPGPPLPSLWAAGLHVVPSSLAGKRSGSSSLPYGNTTKKRSTTTRKRLSVCRKKSSAISIRSRSLKMTKLVLLLNVHGQY